MSDFVSNLGTFKPSTFSGDKPKQRMAGDYMSEFVNANDKKDNKKDFTYEGNNGQNYGTNTERMLFGNSPKKENKKVSKQASSSPSQTTPAASAQLSTQTSGGFTLKPPKSGGDYYEDHAEVKAAWNGEYDEDEYRYYVGKDGVSTGADAYHTDMAKYQAQMEWSANRDVGRHLGLVNSMMHPDWQDHNYNGTYGEINGEANYNSPNNPAWQRLEQQKKKMGSYGG